MPESTQSSQSTKVASTTSQASKGAMSRIGSFKRTWEDVKENTEEVYEWEATQPPAKKQAIARPAPGTVKPNPKEVQERRIKAIQAALDGSSTAKHEAKASSSKPTSVKINAAPGVGAIFHSPDQRYVVDQAVRGKNIFYTGSAGTGKSVVLREIIKQLAAKHSRSGDALAVTASTGIAACNIGGVTLHAFAGAGLLADAPDRLVAKIRKNKKSLSRWLRCKVLIIDEISMVDGDLFDKLNKIGMMLRSSTKPFGGIQIIATGDFFQLPPVTKGTSPKFAFEADCWKDCMDVTFNLTQVFRQKDQEFANMLNRMRLGETTDKDTAKLKRLARDLVGEDGIGLEPTELFPRREDVERANTTRMTQLRGSVKRFQAIDSGTIVDAEQREKLLANFMAPKELQLCVHSQVMMIKNTDDELMNGSMGKVIGFVEPSEFRGYDHTTKQMILIEEIFDTDTKEGKRAMERKKKMVEEGRIDVVPVVAWQRPGGGEPTVKLVQRENFKMELPNGEIQVQRSQFPLILAWAMSIHKSQGQTLDLVKVDLGRVFEKGQSYVALSRATSLQGLQVLNFNSSKVMAHPKVINWYKTLATISEVSRSKTDNDEQ